KMTIFIMSVMDGNHLAGLFTASLAGAVLGFWFFNFNPASIFMGDSGSLFLGFVLSIMSISATYKGSIALGILPVIALGIPVLDIFMAVIRRTAGGRSIFKADREHIHHRLLSLGLSQRQVVAIIYTFCLLLSMMALILKQRQV
ncbi:MAG: undecaprenyl/decaprenyl-phosphate alpha-N-acetylglucosaminyl 1-phosphate transferase, partial [Deltaproteobacteria bacterium]|nr:undecaprenyl/decaprenyl-phosphate alpha-N-acetylglucosaminyl 1-phosphate transferase [Deltaproteobacteria bacterium]